MSQNNSSESSDEWDEYLMENVSEKYSLNTRQFWVHDLWKAHTEGEYFKTCINLRNYPDKFHEYFRMSIPTFDYILNIIQDDLRRYSNFRTCVEPAEKLAIALRLRFFSTGLSFRSLSFSFRLHHFTICKIIDDVCKTLWNKLSTIHLAVPDKNEFLKISYKFNDQWNFPICIGCIDGKHIRIKCPPKSGTMYYNYKHFYSIVLQGVAHANCRFIFIYVGSYGKQSDGGTFSNSNLYNFLEDWELKLPPPKTFERSAMDMPFVMLGDDAYPLKTYLMKPFSKRQLTQEEIIFNYRLSRARHCIECAFGIASSKWRLLNKPIETNVEKAVAITKTICLLHNIVIDLEGPANIAATQEAFQAYTAQAVESSVHFGSVRQFNHSANEANNVRDAFKIYFNGPAGSIPFQNKCLNP